MRISPLSRSLIAVAALSITSSLLTAAPATAASPSEITRADVLAVATTLQGKSDPKNYGKSATRALRKLIHRACAADAEEYVVMAVRASAIERGSAVDGAVVLAVLFDNDALSGSVLPEEFEAGMVARVCSFAAVVPADAAHSLTGTASFSFGSTTTTPLSGNVAVTPAIVIDAFGGEDVPARAALATSGQAVATILTPTTSKISTPKSARQKKAAQKTYSKALKSAKKSYAKALKNAGKSTTKKATAKKAYSARKVAAKASYRKAVATFKVVNSVNTRTESYPFAAAAEIPFS